MSVAQIAGLAFTSEDRVRDVLHNFNADGCASLYPRYAGGHPPRFTLAQRREIMKIAKSASADHGLAFRGGARPSAPTSWSPGVVDDISHDALRALLRTESISVQAMKTWKAFCADPDYTVKKARMEHLYAIADGQVIAKDGEPR